MNPKKFYTTPEAAEILGVSRSALYQQSREGRLPEQLGAVRIGTRTVFPKAALDRLAEGGAAA